MLKYKKNNGFTLVEILLGILIVTTIVIGGFQALSSITVGKVRLVQETETQKQALYFSERLFEMIKYGGTIDYEEYFNRSVVNSGVTLANLYSSGHYQQLTGFGNFGHNGDILNSIYGSGFYQCRSGSGTSMGTGGCVSSSYNTAAITMSETPQRYGQYSFHFIDYNSNEDFDAGILGDEDGDGNIIGDDDDEYLGYGPNVFPIKSDVKELYLIDGDKRNRTLFRYNVGIDPYGPVGAGCISIDDEKTFTGSGCLGTVEFLKLEGRDWGLNHDVSTIDTDGSQSDGVIDTWLIGEEFSTGTGIIAGSGSYWQPLFPDDIHVTEFKVFPHPNIDTNRAWRIDSDDQNVSEYLRIQLGMMPGWKDRKKITGTPQEYKFSTTINLTDILTR